jgi:hypothetical protein
VHLMRTRQDSPPMRRDSNLCISESEFAYSNVRTSIEVSCRISFPKKVSGHDRQQRSEMQRFESSRANRLVSL